MCQAQKASVETMNSEDCGPAADAFAFPSRSLRRRARLRYDVKGGDRSARVRRSPESMAAGGQIRSEMNNDGRQRELLLPDKIEQYLFVVHLLSSFQKRMKTG